MPTVATPNSIDSSHTAESQKDQRRVLDVQRGKRNVYFCQFVLITSTVIIRLPVKWEQIQTFLFDRYCMSRNFLYLYRRLLSAEVFFVRWCWWWRVRKSRLWSGVHLNRSASGYVQFRVCFHSWHGTCFWNMERSRSPQVICFVCHVYYGCGAVFTWFVFFIVNAIMDRPFVICNGYLCVYIYKYKIYTYLMYVYSVWTVSDLCTYLTVFKSTKKAKG